MANTTRPGDGSSEEVEILKHLSATDIRSLERTVGSGRILTTDKDYADEVARLEASTRRYTAQTKALTAQQHELLQRLPQPSSSRLVKRAHFFSQRALSKAQYAKTLNDDSINELRDRLQAASTLLDGLSKTLPSSVSELLRAHDGAISALESDGLQNDDDDDDDDDDDVDDTNVSLSDNSRIELLATALAKHRADALRNHLDRIFLDNLSTTPPADDGDDESPADSASAAEELHELEKGIQALYIEIDDVSSMLVSQEYLQPLQASINQDRASRAAAKATKLHNTIQKLETFTDELSSWDKHAQTVRSGLVLHRHLNARLVQMESDVKATVQLPSPLPAPPSKVPPSKLELATERCLSHIGAAGGSGSGNNSSGQPESTASGGSGGGDRRDEILDLLEGAVSARRAAVASLAAAAQTSAPHVSTGSLDELDARVSEAQQRLVHLLQQSRPS